MKYAKNQERYTVTMNSKGEYIIKSKPFIFNKNRFYFCTKKIRMINDYVVRNNLTLYKHKSNKLYYVKRG